MHSRFVPVFMVLLATCNPTAPGHDAGSCEGYDPRGPEEIAVCTQLGERLIINVAHPEGAPPPGGWPAVILLHGSGGLYETTGEGDDLGPCSMELKSQFREWRDLLTDRGYVVAMPASFYSRGMCEWHEKVTDRLVLRVFDTRATEDWLCDQTTVDCDRMALLGFSNGASVALMSAQSDLSITRDERLREAGPNRPVRGVVAYYPGCGLEGELSESIDPAQLDLFYSPLAPVVVQHGENDDLLEACADMRDPQVELVDKVEGHRGDWFDLRVYNGAGHSFDNADANEESDFDARTAAQASTLTFLDAWLQN